jgi:Protein of unknown function (DUF3667)
METATEPTPAAAPAAAPALPKSICSNCGADLEGPYCYSCGQPVKGMIRPLSSMMHDVADTIFNIDSRIFRTLLPLYFRPGYLSNEYFAGRRVRYVTPFRLYFFLSVAAFLLIQVGLDSSLDMAKDVIRFDTTRTDVASARTPQEVETRRDEALAELEKAKASAGMPGVATKQLDRAEDKIRAQAEKRLQKLQDDAKDKGANIPAKPGDNAHVDVNVVDDDIGWDPKRDPIHVGWLPDFVNTKLNNIAGHMKENVPRIRKDPKPFLIGAFGTLPQVLFVLMPLFALLLKFFYMFKRRLYMEHLIVGLHSHAFVFMSLIFITLAMLVRGWARTTAPWLAILLDWLLFAMWTWLPIYLFLTAKKVYKQGWFFTTIKYGMVGICYTIMISFGIAAAFVISLAIT